PIPDERQSPCICRCWFINSGGLPVVRHPNSKPSEPHVPFVNPLELLGIPANGPAPDAETLRKARRAKLLEFDLSDGGVIHHGRLAVSRTDFQRACSDLDDPKKLAGYR